MTTRRPLALLVAASLILLVGGCARAPESTSAGGDGTAAAAAARAVTTKHAAPTPSIDLAETIASSDLRRRLRPASWIRVTAGAMEVGTEGDGVPLAVVSYGNAKRAVHVLDILLGKPRQLQFLPDAADDPCSTGGVRYTWGGTSRYDSGTVSLEDDADDASNPLGIDFQLALNAPTATSVHGTTIDLAGPNGELVGTDPSEELGDLPASDRAVSQPGSMGEATIALIESGWSGDSEDADTDGDVPAALGVTMTVKDDVLTTITVPDSLHGSAACPRTDTEAEPDQSDY